MSKQKLKKTAVSYEVDPDLDLKVHLYDFRMTKGETLDYIEKAVIPERLKSYQSILFDYALFANSFTYLLVTKSRNYKMPQNVKNIMELIMLLKDRGIFVELFERKEVCDMVAANFSAENIKRYEYMEEGRTKGRLEGRHEGKLEGKAEAIFNLLQNGGTEEQARRFLLATSDQIAEAKRKLSMKS